MGIIWNVIVCILMSLPCVCGTEGERGGGRKGGERRKRREREKKRTGHNYPTHTHTHMYTYL